MKQNEYSSGGSEYFPTGQEFSSPRREFPRTAPEIIPASAEVNQSGSEFHQGGTTGVKAEKKRRRNISPAMLTTAAIVTAAVTVLPLSRESSWQGWWDYPAMELSAESKAYLDEVWAAMPAGDAERLAALGTDGRLQAFSENEVPPYLDMLAQDYGFPKEDLEPNNNGTYTQWDNFHGAILYYDGQSAGWNRFQEEHTLNFHYYEYVENEYPDDLYTSAHFYFTETVDEDSYSGSSVYVHNGFTGYKRNDHLTVDYEKGRYVSVDPDVLDYVLDEGVLYHEGWITDPETGELIDHDRVTAEGDFAFTVTHGETEEGRTITVRTYLYNGCIIFYREENGYQGEFRLDVVDGILQIPDGVVLSYHEPTDYYTLYAEFYDSDGNVIQTQGLVSSERSLVGDEVLDVRNWHFDYASSSVTYGSK